MPDTCLVRAIARALASEGVTGGIVVAVSGGPDSVALLHALTELSPCGGSLVAAHLNHRLRGAESDADEDFVRRLCQRLAVRSPVLSSYCEAVDVARLAMAKHENLEKVARETRYAWLAQVASQTHCAWVATAHTANDQAETVLHHLLRGTGLRGLRGIARRRTLVPGVSLIRPMLAVSRGQVLAYLADHGHDYRMDGSNADWHRTRNRIRHELLPRLAERYNPQIVSSLCRLAGQVADVVRHEDTRARRLLGKAERPRAGNSLVFDSRRLAHAPRRVVREVFRLAWRREGWPMGRMGFEDWDCVAAVALGQMVAADLPGAVRVRRRGWVVCLQRSS